MTTLPEIRKLTITHRSISTRDGREIRVIHKSRNPTIAPPECSVKEFRNETKPAKRVQPQAPQDDIAFADAMAHQLENFKRSRKGKHKPKRDRGEGWDGYSFA